MIRVGIVGGTGYTGAELLRLLAGHRQASVVAVTSRAEAGRPVADHFPSLRGRVDLIYTEPDAATLSQCDLVFFATPNGTAMEAVPELVEAGVRVVDLAADFRLRDPKLWATWYGMEHRCPELLKEAVYGLPEVNRERIRSARLVANPGCYPTAVQLGFLPLLEAGLVDADRLIADAKSGVSGAGRKLALNTLFCEAGDNFKAYGVPGHRHLPEIAQELELAAGKPVGLTFVPHLTPMIRGIHATLYAELIVDRVDLQLLYEKRFADEPFVDVMPPGSHPDTASVRGDNVLRLACHRPGGGKTVVVLAVEDNLVKGASGQAIQNMNIMFGFDEREGLAGAALCP
ncbi:MAG: N-acetyl-gamma-glutamyl-phosphate reductase [Gammaproteobacteria bacterium]|nr:N-acetyl-gamma-glutamyl-phosphate reductase [Gammaproteobacteria bacterium]MDH3411177.1 N-acetyl-gamma-glutamyl-phosphate reductase [Gammaproteobacteria bacterium]